MVVRQGIALKATDFGRFLRIAFLTLFLTLLATSAWAGLRILSSSRLPTAEGHADVAIVLGAAVWGERPSPVFAARIDHALDLLAAQQVEQIIFTGGMSSGDQMAESEAAARYALGRGVPLEHLRCETTSRTTWGNLSAAARLMEQEGWQSAHIVSDPLHIYRAGMMAEELGITALLSPTPYTRYRTWNSQLPFFLREIFFTMLYGTQRLLHLDSSEAPEIGNGICRTGS